jgi:hypothetical protein
MYELGLLYKNGLGVKKNVEKAVKLWEKASSFPPKIITLFKVFNNRGVTESMI